MLLQGGVDVDAVNDGGETPLLLTVSRITKVNTSASLTVMELLVVAGAKVDSCDRAGQTALHFAAFKGSVAVLDRLLHHGAYVDQTDRLGRSALWFAARHGRCEATKFLIERGAQVNLQDYEKSALWAAVYAKELEIVNVLLEHGADVNQLGLQGDPLLTRLVRYRILDSAIAEQLLQAWADPNIEDYEGLTTLDNAIMWGSSVLKQVLVEYNAVESGKQSYRAGLPKYKAMESLDSPKRLTLFREKRHSKSSYACMSKTSGMPRGRLV